MSKRAPLPGNMTIAEDLPIMIYTQRYIIKPKRNVRKSSKPGAQIIDEESPRKKPQHTKYTKFTFHSCKFKVMAQKTID